MAEVRDILKMAVEWFVYVYLGMTFIDLFKLNFVSLQMDTLGMWKIIEQVIKILFSLMGLVYFYIRIRQFVRRTKFDNEKRRIMPKKVKNIDQVIKQLRALGEVGDDIIADVSEATAREIEATAKQLAPLDLGALKRSIKAIKINDQNWKVQANATGNAPYAAYVEFGTGGTVNIPSELREIASSYRGRGIKTVNMPPRPYLFPAFVRGRIQFGKDLQNELNKLL